MLERMDESAAQTISYLVGIALCWIGIGLMLYAMIANPTPYVLLFAGIALVPLSAVISRSTRLVLQHEVRNRRR